MCQPPSWTANGVQSSLQPVVPSMKLHLTTLLGIVALGIGSSASTGRAAAPVRVGILGFDNYQAVEYVQFFNNPKAEGDLAGLRVVAAYPVTSAGYPESAALTERWQKQMLSLYQNPR